MFGASFRANVASRLESHTKIAGRAILIDEATRNALKPGVRVEALGPVGMKGKSVPVEVFSVSPAPST